MGLFGDLFKEKVNWSEEELMALFACMYVMSAIDGEVHEDESEFAALEIAGLPSKVDYSPGQLLKIGENAFKIPYEGHVKVLRSMHKNKKDIAIAAMKSVGMADGDFDSDEKLLLEKFRKALK